MYQENVEFEVNKLFRLLMKNLAAVETHLSKLNIHKTLFFSVVSSLPTPTNPQYKYYASLLQVTPPPLSFIKETHKPPSA